MAKRALVAGAGGFIGHHLVKYLVANGYWVRGVDTKVPEYEPSKADEFEVLDAIEESKRIRENIFKGKSISEGEVPTKLQIIKKKKKKKFIFF